MASGISISFSLAQVALFFAACGIGVVTVAALLLEAWIDRRGNSTGDMVVGCSSVVLIGGAIQLFSSVFLYFKDEVKSKWVNLHVFLLILYIVCFSVPLAENVRGTSVTDAFYAGVLINWLLLFLAVGFMSNNAVPVSFLFSMLGIAVVLSCSLVLKEYSSRSGHGKLIGCSSAGLVGGIVQTATSIYLFFKEDFKKFWTYGNALVFVLLVVCFAVPLEGGFKGSQTEYYYGILGIDFVALFIVVGMFLKSMHF